MDSNLVSDLLSSTEGSGGDSTTAPLKTYTDDFNSHFPYYLSIGMTEGQYWDDDTSLTVAYRKAEQLRMDRRNQEMWLQGAYIYEAIGRVSPILQAFAKKGTKPRPYLEEPFSLTASQVQSKKEREERKVYDKGKALLEGFMMSHNKKFKRGDDNGDQR